MKRRLFSLLCLAGAAVFGLLGCSKDPTPAPPVPVNPMPTNPGPQAGSGGDKKPAVPTAADFAAKALSESDGTKRAEAAIELAMLQGPETLPALRKVAGQTQDANVLVQVLTGLAARNDVTSLPIFIGFLEHQVLPVRQIALQGALRLTGTKAEQWGYPPEGGEIVPMAASGKLLEAYKKGKEKPAP